MRDARPCDSRARQIESVATRAGARGRPAGGASLVALVGRQVAFGRVVLLALMAHRRGDRGNANLAVAAVEVAVLALGVLALLRCLACIHRRRPLASLGVRVLGCSRSLNLPPEWGGIARQFVSYRDIRPIPPVFAPGSKL